MTKQNITSLTSLRLSSESNNKIKGFYQEAITTAQRDLIPTIPATDTIMIVNSTTGTIQVGTQADENTPAVYRTVNTSAIGASANFGTGLVAGNTPFVFPSGTLAGVETAAGTPNNVTGFAYNNTTAAPDMPRYYNGTSWVTVNTTNATGATLAAGSPFILGSGLAATVEVAADNLKTGFIYTDTTTAANVRFRVYDALHTAALWRSIVTSTATGVALTTGVPVELPTGPQATVEVEGNEKQGFIYCESDGAHRVRLYNNGVWGTITFTPDA